MDTVLFSELILFMIIRRFSNASLVLTSSPDYATKGIDFTFTCTTSSASVYFRRDDTLTECQIYGVKPDGTCHFGYCNPNYTYDCDKSNGVYKLTIPSSFDINYLLGTSWKCFDAVNSGESKPIIINLYISITQVTVKTLPTDMNPIEIISSTNQMFECETDAGRPSSRIQWYISGTNITEFATPVESTTIGNKFISSSTLTYTGNITDEGKIIYCTAVNIQGQSVMSQNKSIVIWYPPQLPSINQTPIGYVNETDLIILTCEIRGGNPLASIAWQCDKSSLVTSSENPPTDKVVSSVQIIATKDINGKLCTCIGTHPTWPEPKSSSKALQIRYAPTFLPSVMQTPPGLVLEGTMTKLTCEISGGNPSPSISWKCNDFTTVDETSTPSNNRVVCSIQRNVTRADDGKVCVCTARHLLWTNDKTVSHILDVNYSPTSMIPTVSQLPPGSVRENTSITFTCEIIGGKPLANITWKCNGSSVISTISTNDRVVSSVLLIVTKDHNRDVCICTGTHPAWTENRSSNIRLNVTYAPVSSLLITQIPNGTVLGGNKVTLTCKVRGGNPLASVVWQCSRFTSVTPSGNKSTDNALAVVQSTVSKDDNGKECICRGTHFLWNQAKTNTHTLNVYYSSTIQILNTNPTTVTENTTMNLICAQIDGNPRNTSFTWYKSNTVIGNKSTYSIRQTKIKDAGNYTCQGSNGIGTHSEDIELHVLYSPRVSVSSVMNLSTIAEYGTAVLQCIVQGNPPPSIMWSKHGSDIILPSKSTEFQSNLTIKNANCLDTNNYTCKAVNLINNNVYITMKDIQLFVTCYPRRYNEHDGSTNVMGLEIGQNLTISEHILAYPIGITSWTFKPDVNSPGKTVYSDSNCNVYNISDHRICFTRLNFTKHEFGLYTVVIVNEVGKATLNIKVNPQGPPKKPTDVLVACEITSMIVSWRPGINEGNEQSFRVVWLNIKTQQVEYSSEIMDSSQEQTKQYIVKSLVPDTTYIIYVEASNKYGIVRSTDFDKCTTRSSLYNSQPNNSLAMSVGVGIGSSVFILLVASLVILILKRRLNNEEENKKVYQSADPGTSRQKTSNDQHNYCELQTTRMDSNPGGMQSNSSNTYEEIGRMIDGQDYQNVDTHNKESKEKHDTSNVYANMKI